VYGSSEGGSLHPFDNVTKSDDDPFLIPPTEWPHLRLEVIRQTGTPSEGLPRLQEREAELAICLAQIERLLPLTHLCKINHEVQTCTVPESAEPSIWMLFPLLLTPPCCLILHIPFICPRQL
jgi:hypothetical protein